MGVLDLAQELKKSLGELPDKGENAQFLIACSGGFDSVVAADLLVKKFGKSRVAIQHFDFGLRGDESDGDAAYVKSLASQWGTDFFLEKAPRREKTSGIQEWARDIRLACYRKHSAAGKVVVTGHHKQDLVENVVLRLVRGSSVGKLAGMKVWDGTVFRPLLGAFPRDIRFYAKKNRLKPREDSSNAKVEYSRNFIRHKVLPLFEELAPGALARVADTASDAAVVSEFFLQELWSKHSHLRAAESDGFPIADWVREKPIEVVTMGLGNWLSRWKPKLRRDFLRGVVTDVKTGSRFLARDLGKKHRIVLENGVIKVCAKLKKGRFGLQRAGKWKSFRAWLENLE